MHSWKHWRLLFSKLNREMAITPRQFASTIDMRSPNLSLERLQLESGEGRYAQSLVDPEL